MNSQAQIVKDMEAHIDQAREGLREVVALAVYMAGDHAYGANEGIDLDLLRELSLAAFKAHGGLHALSEKWASLLAAVGRTPTAAQGNAE